MVHHREFVGEVCAAFGLGAPRSIRAIGGGANLVWRLESEAGIQVVKELPADSADVLGRAAEFERGVFGAGVVPMAEPRADREGRLLRPMRGSRGEPALVRVHRSVQGRETGRPVAAATARAAGRSLARVQAFGAVWDGEVGSLPDRRVWLRPDRETFDAFAGSRPELIKDGWAALVEAEELVSEWADGAEDGISTHCDHKPENSLRDGEKLIILDWDEAGACDPRIEAVEAAARWAWAGSAGPDAGHFADFVAGYRDEGRPFEPLRRADWAKWVAGIASWYEFKAQRSLGRWAAVASARDDEAEAAAQTLGWLRDTLRRIPQWTTMINNALSPAPGRARPSDR
ncbi:hypothetical protein [Microlunatus sp. GCM10028923]|uniref:hypothetical protein n=1 Tax=Microlunatus sp. GCM10028923 TaxID=3273400 RepID=UPI003617B87B